MELSLALSLGSAAVRGVSGPPPVPAAPTLTVSVTAAGRVVTIQATGWTGYPAPTFALHALTLDGASVLGAATQADFRTWSYTVASAAAARTVAGTIRATNSEGTADAGGSVVIPADLFAPTLVASSSRDGRTVTVEVLSVTGTPAPGVSPAATVAGSTVELTEVIPGFRWTWTEPSRDTDRVFSWVVTASNGVGSPATASGSETIPADLAPSGLQAPVGSVTADVWGGLTFDLDDPPAGVDRMVVTLSAPPPYVGADTVALSAFAAGPVALAPPSAAGTLTAGSVIDITPGLWLSETGAASVTRELWRGDAGGGGVPTTQLVIADDLTYTLTADDVTRGVTLRERGADANGTSAWASVVVIQPAYVPRTITFSNSAELTAIPMAAARKGLYVGRFENADQFASFNFLFGSSSGATLLSSSGITVRALIRGTITQIDSGNVGSIPSRSASWALAFDMDKTALGADSVQIWINGAKIWSSTSTSAGNVNPPTAIAAEYAVASANFVGAFRGFLWAHHGATLDMATHWGSFFDASQLPKNLGTGVVGGITPNVLLRDYGWPTGTNDGSGADLTVTGTITVT